MHTDIKEIQRKLTEKGLKITPQRISILKAIYTLNNHPTAEQLIEFIRREYPNIAVGTVYKTLDTFVKNEVIHKISTENDAMRYDGILTNHHHIHSSGSNHIEDYKNEALDKLLIDFFKKNAIEGYEIESIKLHIKGKFTHNK